MKKSRSQNSMLVRFLDFSRYHGKNPPTGSTQLRVHQLIKYWDEAELYLYGQKTDVLIFQKVYTTPDYNFHKHFKGIKILDVCDPDWFNGLTNIKDTVDAVDAITTSSDGLRDFFKQLTNKPVVTIKDRFDISLVPAPKKHTSKAKSVVWFGYRHNAETLRPAMNVIEELGLSLTVISDDDPMAWRWITKNDAQEYKTKKYKFIKYNEDTFYKDLQKSDLTILPKSYRPEDRFKSNNKTIKSILAGLPVASDDETLRKFISAKERNKFIKKHYNSVKQEYDVRNSIEEYKKLINELSTSIKNTD